MESCEPHEWPDNDPAATPEFISIWLFESSVAIYIFEILTIRVFPYAQCRVITSGYRIWQAVAGIMQPTIGCCEVSPKWWEVSRYSVIIGKFHVASAKTVGLIFTVLGVEVSWHRTPWCACFNCGGGPHHDYDTRTTTSCHAWSLVRDVHILREYYTEEANALLDLASSVFISKVMLLTFFWITWAGPETS